MGSLIMRLILGGLLPIRVLCMTLTVRGWL